MGVNMAGNCIVDDEVCRRAARQEIIRRLYTARCQERRGVGNENELNKLNILMQRMGLSDADRPVISAARTKAEATGAPACAM